mgnify:CR=1 FL=1
METTENDLTVNDHDPEGARATDERDSFIPRAYDKEWPLLATSRDQGNKKYKRNRGPNALKKLTDDLNKMKARIEQTKKNSGGGIKKKKTRKRRRKNKMRRKNKTRRKRRRKIKKSRRRR